MRYKKNKSYMPDDVACVLHPKDVAPILFKENIPKIVFKRGYVGTLEDVNDK